ncbi:hypothetical protein SAMN05216304_103132 [Bosea sp. OK403]|nr:hypothetical protein SAMN05216304_103132 [Bosea sp. OK403]
MVRAAAAPAAHPVIARSVSDEAIQEGSLYAFLDCFAALAMTALAVWTALQRPSEPSFETPLRGSSG